MDKRGQWSPSTRFTIHTVTEYEQLPVKTGHYKIIHDGYFDGERFYTGQYSPQVKCIRQESEYTIEDELHTFRKSQLENLLASGNLHIKSSSEDNA